jgi:hypothetical protein
MTPKKRLAVQIIHGALAVTLVVYSFYTDSEITTTITVSQILGIQFWHRYHTKDEVLGAIYWKN